MDMQVNVPLPSDADGFLRRKCPKCAQEFKWHSGPTTDRPADWNDPPVYWCPLCGQASDTDDFTTDAQAEYAQEYAAGPAMQQALEEIERQLRGAKGITFKPDFGNLPEQPRPLVDPNDMSQIQPPCHSWEPVKVPDDSRSPYYCLACGTAYAV